MAASTESSPAPAEAYHHKDPHHLATIFAQEYYTFLNKQPSSLHMFYNEKATLTHGHQGRADVTISQGLKASFGILCPPPPLLLQQQVCFHMDPDLFLCSPLPPPLIGHSIQDQRTRSGRLQDHDQ
jgi:hypothetical protein